MKKLLSAALLSLAVASQGWTASIIFELNDAYTSPAPSGTPPWLRATFTDTPSGVDLYLENLLEGTSEFVGSNGVNGWLFNFNPNKTISSLVFTFQSGANTADAINKGSDIKNAGGSPGYFDIQFEWNSGDRFKKDQTAKYLITSTISTELLVASDFNFLDTAGFYHSVAHVQGIGTNDDSSWIGDKEGNGGGGGGGNVIPEPGTFLLLGSGLVGLALYGRRKLGR